METGDDLASFATAVSHDFSAPLRTIRGFAGLLEDALGLRMEETERGYLSEIVTAAGRMQTLNRALVTCVRARTAPMEYAELSLDEVLQRCLDDLAPRIAAAGALVSSSRLPVVHADAAAITLVLHHLVDNALRYAKPGQALTITVSAARGDSDWTVVVSDNGPGIAEASRERVFTLFNRLDPASHMDRPGIGLSLSRTLIERHGGRLWMGASPGGGAEATFTLPRREAHPDVAAPVSYHTQTDADLAAIVRCSGDAMFSKDLSGVITSWNHAAETLYGFSSAETIGRNVSMLVPAGRAAEATRLLDGVRAGALTHVETVRVRKDGTQVDVALTISPIRDHVGMIVAASVVARDITERHRVDEDLRAFLEATPDAIIVVDRTGAISTVSPQALATFGYTREQLVGSPLEMLIPERFRNAHVAHRLRFTARPNNRPMGTVLELVGLKRDGTEFPVDIQLSSVRTRDGTLPVATIRDVTERRRLEHLRDDFIGNAAHELRTPLTTLAGLGETLARHFDVMSRSDIEDAFAAMARQGDRAKVLIDNLLDLSNIEGARLDFEMASVGLRELIDNVIEAAPPPAASAVTVTVPRDITVLADPARLEQIISNLLVNAYRYGGPDVRVHSRREKASVVFSVTDDGAGVAPALVPTLFEPFTRGTTTSVVRGSGIGLALCRRIAEGMNGEIWFASEVPHGAGFHVRLGQPS